MLASLLLLALATDVQGLIDRARPGDTVRVPEGIHRERLVITKDLVLDGGGRAVLDGGGTGTIVSARGARVTLRGLTLRSSGESFLEEDSAIRLEDCNGSVVEDCRLEDVLFGLYVAKSSRCTFRRLKIGGKPLEMPRRGDGVRLWYSDDTLLESIEMADSRDFIIWFARGTIVRNCDVVRGRYGLHYMYCDDNRFENNRFSGNQVGGTIMYSRRITMTGNRFERSRGPSAYGMLLKDADDVVAEGNAFVDNTRGLYFDNSPQSELASCVIRRNLFALNDAGVTILPDTRRAEFRSNTFRDNLVSVEIIGYADPAKNTWEGNYWSDHAPYDEDGDGRGDLPYRPERSYEDLVSRHPSLALLRFSPSVSAIEFAGRLFPIARGDLQLEDASPSVRPTIGFPEDTPPGSSLPVLVFSVLLVLAPVAARRWAERGMR